MTEITVNTFSLRQLRNAILDFIAAEAIYHKNPDHALSSPPSEKCRKEMAKYNDTHNELIELGNTHPDETVPDEVFQALTDYRQACYLAKLNPSRMLDKSISSKEAGVIMNDMYDRRQDLFGLVK